MRLFHKHDWETVKIDVVDIYDEFYTGTPIEYKYVEIQRCKKCGKLRKQVIRY